MIRGCNETDVPCLAHLSGKADEESSLFVAGEEAYRLRKLKVWASCKCLHIPDLEYRLVSSRMRCAGIERCKDAPSSALRSFLSSRHEA